MDRVSVPVPPSVQPGTERVASPLRARTSFAAGLVVSVFMLNSAACATIEMKHVNTSERVMESEKEREETNKNVLSIKEDGEVPTLSVRKRCVLYARDKLKITKHSEAKNQSAAADWALGISGAALAGLGTWIIVDAKNVYPSDTSSRTYGVGQGTAQGLGVFTAGVGAVGLLIAGVDVARAQGTSDDESFGSSRRLTAEGCEGAPVSGAKVVARFDEGAVKGTTLALGETLADGTLSMDLGSVEAPRDVCRLDQAPWGEKATVLVDGEPAGSLALALAYSAWTKQRAQRDAETWAAAERGAAMCRSAGACGAVERYLSAKLCSEGGADRVATMTGHIDDGVWSRVDPAGCEMSAETSQCVGVEGYINRFPEGRHLEEARRLLAEAKSRSDKEAFRLAESRCLPQKGATNCGPMIEWRSRQQQGSARFKAAEKVLKRGVPPIVDSRWAQTRELCKAPAECDVDSFLQLVEAASPWLSDSASRAAAARGLKAQADEMVRVRSAARTATPSAAPSRVSCEACEKQKFDRHRACTDASEKCVGSKCATQMETCFKNSTAQLTSCAANCSP